MKYLIQIFTLDTPQPGDDYSFCPPNQPYWEVEAGIVPEMMTAIQSSMAWATTLGEPCLVVVAPQNPTHADDTLLCVEYKDGVWASRRDLIEEVS